MTPQRWARIKEIFGPALETPESERPAFLERYADLLKDAYPAQADGKILLPYPRLFFIAVRAA